MDMMKMMEQAKALSDIFNESNTINSKESKNNKEDTNDKETSSPSELDTEQITKMIKLAQIMKTMNNESEENKNNQENTIQNIQEEKNYIQPFDSDLQTPAIRTIKAAIPYLEFEYQKNMGVLVKIIELDNLMKKYKSAAVEMQSNNVDWRRGMLLSIKPQMNYEKQKVIEMIIKFMDLKEIMECLNINNKEVK